MKNTVNHNYASGRLAICILVLIGFLCFSGCFCPECPEVGCCEDSAQVGTVEGNGSNWIFLWIAAYKDTYVYNQELDSSFNCVDDLRVTFLPHGEFKPDLRRTYVDFVMPRLPEGFKVTEAYLNLYNPAFRGDGTSDKIEIPVREALAYWPACTLTWRTQPEDENVFVSNGGFQLQLRSQSWFGSTVSIDKIVSRMIDNPNTNEGFILYLPAPPIGGQSAQKAFWSNNHQSRTSTDVGLAPRLLIRVKLPNGTDESDIVMPPLPGDNDLGALGDEVMMLRIANTSDSSSLWPASWQVPLPNVP
ncbi:MAG: DNRLRE domain-containing protein [Candidatus Brocadiaceae bacterium]|nr:DNRLRE domain-containing protein [Candidatus Brocadiaceae bacterium]